MKHLNLARTFSFLVLLCVSTAANANEQFTTLPSDTGRSKALKIRFVHYTGGSTGRMIVDIKNTSNRAQRFEAKGLFFVPRGDPEKAPQRLGAAGPFEEGGKQKKSVILSAGSTKRLHLQVFCLDSHRASPSAAQSFRVAKKLLPKTLRRQIASGAKYLIKAGKRKMSRDTLNSQIQGHVWRTRNAKWIEIEGERASEKSPSRGQTQGIEQTRNGHR
jgi:hypothetical protein